MTENNIIQCPNCEGKGVLTIWDQFPNTTKDINCEWCRGLKEINKKNWITYQPHHQRPKKLLDIKLKNGTTVECCWPNAVSWNLMKEHKGYLNPKWLTDENVMEVRVSEHGPF